MPEDGDGVISLTSDDDDDVVLRPQVSYGFTGFCRAATMFWVESRLADEKSNSGTVRSARKTRIAGCLP